MSEIMRIFPAWWPALWGAVLLCWAVMLGFRGLRRAVLVPLAVAGVCILPSFIAWALRLGERSMPALMLLGLSPVIVLAVTLLTLGVMAWRGRRAAGAGAGASGG